MTSTAKLQSIGTQPQQELETQLLELLAAAREAAIPDTKIAADLALDLTIRFQPRDVTVTQLAAVIHFRPGINSDDADAVASYLAGLFPRPIRIVQG